MDSGNVPADQSVKGSAIKSKILQSMTQFRNAKEDVEQQQRKSGSKKPKFLGRSEEEVGINQFVDPSEGFTGITKHRWGDFIVHEIDLSGEVVTLTDTSVPVKKEEAKIEVVRPDWFPEDIWEKVVEMSAVQKCGDAVSIPAGLLTKEQRTQYHVTIKGFFPKLVTNTGETDGEKTIVVKRANAAPDKLNTFWKHKPWPKDRPKFLHFCLFKENTDTFEALSNISMDLKVKSNKFACAGTKDARAKTTQMVSVKQIAAEKVHEAARKFPRIAVGNFSYKDSELKLGDLKGNQFDLVLRHVQGSDEVISRRMGSFQSHGFINYYGLQRFGTTSSGTHHIGRAILHRQWRRAVDLVLSGRETETNAMGEAQRAWHASRDPRRALSCLTGKQQRTSIEGRVLHTLSSVRPDAYQEAVDRLPAGTRQLYVHAYQSWLWNQVVSRRLAEHGLKLLPGDLVLTGDPLTVEDQPAPDDEDAADEPAADDAAATDAEKTESGAAENGGANGRSPFLPRLPEVRVLTEADLESHSVYDLVLPLPGWAVRYPDNELAKWYSELLTADGVELTRERCDSMPQYSIAGAYRHVMARPDSFSWRLMRYSDPTVDLTPSDLDRVRGRQPPTDQPDAPFRALLLQFSLPSSSYATMALREITGSDSSLASQMKLNEAYSAEMRRVRQEAAVAGQVAARREKREAKAVANAADTEEKPAAAGDQAAASATTQDDKLAEGDNNEAENEDMDAEKGRQDVSAPKDEKSVEEDHRKSAEGEVKGQGEKRPAEDEGHTDEKRQKTEDAA